MRNQKESKKLNIENRKANHQYHIEDTLETGIVLTGSEVKSIKDGQISLAEGWIRASLTPIELSLHGVHISEYINASPNDQHKPLRVRKLLAHKPSKHAVSLFYANGDLPNWGTAAAHRAVEKVAL